MRLSYGRNTAAVVVVVVFDCRAAVVVVAEVCCVCVVQSLFSGTELLQTLLVLPLCDAASQCTPSPRRCLAILSVAMFHIITASYDQFTANVLRGKGAWHQRSRDLGFMLVDVLYVVVTTIWWCQLLRQFRRLAFVSRSELMLAVVAVILLFILSLAA